MTTLPVSLPGSNADALLWADPDTVEPAALDQLRAIGDLPWLAKLRVMPDVHLGKGATVGSVIAMKDAISPSAVGVDIGCGMQAVCTNLTVNDLPDDLGPLRTMIEEAVPVGFNAHPGSAYLGHTPAAQDLIQRFGKHMDRFTALAAHEQVADRRSKAIAQCGSLGGGNHFIELCADIAGRIWITLHSGSRNIGKMLADVHISKAKSLEHNTDLPDRDLAVFLADTREMSEYLRDLHWAQDYARLNREVMMHLVKRVLVERFGVSHDVQFDSEISCHHNYVAHETYADTGDVIVTRKGAIRAGAGELGIIPGSMATGSYIVRGLGNETGLNSASHGAGRRMSRTKAKKAYTTADLEAQTFGVECRKDDGVLDEIPGAYKDLRTVIDAQTTGPEPLVKVVARLTTLLCVKG